MTQRISCDAHDYFEIVCMRNSFVVVTTNKGQVFKGKALNIVVVDNKEVLKLSTEDQVYHVNLMDIKILQAAGNTIEQHNFIVQW